MRASLSLGWGPIVFALSMVSAVAVPLNTHSAAARSVMPLPNATPFRAGVERLYHGLHPLCPMTPNSDTAMTAPGRALMMRFRQEITGTAYGALYDATMRDVLRRRAQIVLECAAPREMPSEALQQRIQNEAQQTIDQLRILMTARR